MERLGSQMSHLAIQPPPFGAYTAALSGRFQWPFPNDRVPVAPSQRKISRFSTKDSATFVRANISAASCCSSNFELRTHLVSWRFPPKTTNERTSERASERNVNTPHYSPQESLGPSSFLLPVKSSKLVHATFALALNFTLEVSAD